MAQRLWWGEAPERPKRSNEELDLVKTETQCWVDSGAEPRPSVVPRQGTARQRNGPNTPHLAWAPDALRIGFGCLGASPHQV
jgi:hypothetical protein